MDIEYTKGELGIGEEISSYSDNLGFALTNPTFISPNGNIWNRVWTVGQTKWRNYLSKDIIYNGKTYYDVEDAYQNNKSDKTNEEKFELMVELLKIKLLKYPKLTEGIKYKGGITYLTDSTHQPSKKNTYWETNGSNAFIKALTEAYIQIKETQKND